MGSRPARKRPGKAAYQAKQNAKKREYEKKDRQGEGSGQNEAGGSGAGRGDNNDDEGEDDEEQGDEGNDEENKMQVDEDGSFEHGSFEHGTGLDSLLPTDDGQTEQSQRPDQAKQLPTPTTTTSSTPRNPLPTIPIVSSSQLTKKDPLSHIHVVRNVILPNSTTTLYRYSSQTGLPNPKDASFSGSENRKALSEAASSAELGIATGQKTALVVFEALRLKLSSVVANEEFWRSEVHSGRETRLLLQKWNRDFHDRAIKKDLLIKKLQAQVENLTSSKQDYAELLEKFKTVERRHSEAVTVRNRYASSLSEAGELHKETKEELKSAHETIDRFLTQSTATARTIETDKLKEANRKVESAGRRTATAQKELKDERNKVAKLESQLRDAEAAQSALRQQLADAYRVQSEIKDTTADVEERSNIAWTFVEDVCLQANLAAPDVITFTKDTSRQVLDRVALLREQSKKWDLIESWLPLIQTAIISRTTPLPLPAMTDIPYPIFNLILTLTDTLVALDNATKSSKTNEEQIEDLEADGKNLLEFGHQICSSSGFSWAQLGNRITRQVIIKKVTDAFKSAKKWDDVSACTPLIVNWIDNEPKNLPKFKVVEGLHDLVRSISIVRQQLSTTTTALQSSNARLSTAQKVIESVEKLLGCEAGLLKMEVRGEKMRSEIKGLIEKETSLEAWRAEVSKMEGFARQQEQIVDDSNTIDTFAGLLSAIQVLLSDRNKLTSYESCLANVAKELGIDANVTTSAGRKAFTVKVREVRKLSIAGKETETILPIVSKWIVDQDQAAPTSTPGSALALLIETVIGLRNSKTTVSTDLGSLQSFAASVATAIGSSTSLLSSAEGRAALTQLVVTKTTSAASFTSLISFGPTLKRFLSDDASVIPTNTPEVIKETLEKVQTLRASVTSEQQQIKEKQAAINKFSGFMKGLDERIDSLLKSLNSISETVGLKQVLMENSFWLTSVVNKVSVIKASSDGATAFNQVSPSLCEYISAPVDQEPVLPSIPPTLVSTMSSILTAVAGLRRQALQNHLDAKDLREKLDNVAELTVEVGNIISIPWSEFETETGKASILEHILASETSASDWARVKPFFSEMSNFLIGRKDALQLPDMIELPPQLSTLVDHLMMSKEGLKDMGAKIETSRQELDQHTEAFLAASKEYNVLEQLLKDETARLDERSKKLDDASTQLEKDREIVAQSLASLQDDSVRYSALSSINRTRIATDREEVEKAKGLVASALHPLLLQAAKDLEIKQIDLDRVNKKVLDLEGQVEKVSYDLSLAKGSLIEEQDKVKALKSKKEQLERDLSTAEQTIAFYEGHVEAKEVDWVREREDALAVRGDRDAVTRKFNDLVDDYNELQDELKEAEKGQQMLQRITREKIEQKKELKKLQLEIKEWRQKNLDLDQLQKNLSRDLGEANTRLESMQKLKEQMQSEAESSRQLAATLKRDAEAANSALKDLKTVVETSPDDNTVPVMEVDHDEQEDTPEMSRALIKINTSSIGIVAKARTAVISQVRNLQRQMVQQRAQITKANLVLDQTRDERAKALSLSDSLSNDNQALVEELSRARKRLSVLDKIEAAEADHQLASVPLAEYLSLVYLLDQEKARTTPTPALIPPTHLCDTIITFRNLPSSPHLTQNTSGGDWRILQARAFRDDILAELDAGELTDMLDAIGTMLSTEGVGESDKVKLVKQGRTILFACKEIINNHLYDIFQRKKVSKLEELTVTGMYQTFARTSVALWKAMEG